jgi:predicted lactoylglutathione lyase
MPTFDSQTAKMLAYIVLAVAGLVLLAIGYLVGRAMVSMRAARELATARNDLFTTQQGFKRLYETEIAQLRAENESFKANAVALQHRIEEYRKKAAGVGGLFSSGNKKADAMYALLLENEALEEALHKQNQKLTTERTDAVQESLRNIGYRRVLMSQLLNDDRIKDYVREILEDERRLPHVDNGQAKLPPA